MYVSELSILIAQSDILLGLAQLLLFFVSLFLILLVLVQRGKGGGLTGALGGMGGQSAFGTKAGDAFTKITIITTLIWITLCMVTISHFNPPPAARMTKKMTLMEKARALDNNPSIGAPSETGDVPSDFTGDTSGAGSGSTSAEGSSSATSAGSGSTDSVDDTGDNVAEKQTPESTGTAEATETEDTSTTQSADSESETADQESADDDDK